MSINHILRKENIENIVPLSTLEVNKIATVVSTKLCNAFPEHNLNQSDLFISLARLNMYTAKMPNTSSSAKYFYKNNSIYFKDNLDFETLDTLSIHECIHFMQELKDENGKLLRMGLYNLEKFKDTGLALNEAAVQTMASICTNCEEDEVKYYNMDIKTISPDYYPLECALINQMIYFTGSYPLFHSTLFSDDIFKNTFIAKSSLKTYCTIEKNFDLILECQDSLTGLLFELQDSAKNLNYIKKINLKIYKLKKQISNLCIETQNLIIKDCFTKEFESIKNKRDLKDFQKHLYNFKNVLIYADNDASFYNTFYCDIMTKLDEKRELLEKNGILTFIERDLALVEADMFNVNLFKKLMDKLKLVVKFRISEQAKNTDNSK